MQANAWFVMMNTVFHVLLGKDGNENQSSSSRFETFLIQGGLQNLKAVFKSISESNHSKAHMPLRRNQGTCLTVLFKITPYFNRSQTTSSLLFLFPFDVMCLSLKHLPQKNLVQHKMLVRVLSGASFCLLYLHFALVTFPRDK